MPTRQKVLIALFLMWAAQPAFAAERGYLGVWFGFLPATEKVPRTGVIVNKVFEGSAAQRAGIKPGEIVTKINGALVPNPKTAVALVSESAAGERIWLTVIETPGGATRQSNVFATLAASPPDGFASIMTAKPKPPPRHITTARHCASSGSAPAQPCPANVAAAP